MLKVVFPLPSLTVSSIFSNFVTEPPFYTNFTSLPEFIEKKNYLYQPQNYLTCNHLPSSSFPLQSDFRNSQ